MKEIMAEADENYIGVSIGVKNGGCAGMEYTMDYATEQGPLDEAVEDNGVKILIDPKAILFLIGSEIDFVTEKLSQRFVFKNPKPDRCLWLRRECYDYSAETGCLIGFPKFDASFCALIFSQL